MKKTEFTVQFCQMKLLQKNKSLFWLTVSEFRPWSTGSIALDMRQCREWSRKEDKDDDKEEEEEEERTKKGEKRQKKKGKRPADRSPTL